ncbi:MAG: glycosyltransferase [Akkermansiaceae bacterium]|nr:glycosyltransferase [Akkermansiaceae bacterium]NNM28842.1 glycosyltransferase [Akkermansiaceae bacterium]
MMFRNLKKALKRWRPLFVAAEVRNAIRRCLRSIGYEWRIHQEVTVPAIGPERGRALFSYRIEGFVMADDDPLMKTHTNYWQSRQMVRTLSELGFTVDVIDYRNARFVPEKKYDVFVDVRNNMERLAPLLGDGCLKIFHIDTAHLLANNAGEAVRLRELADRRRVALQARRFEQPSRGIEFADRATGNAGPFAVRTHEYAGTPIHPLPAPVAQLHDWPADKDWERCRSRFLWMGSGGLVHKGLDLVLEAFALLPDCHLTVCAPLDSEPDFKRAFHRELYDSPNVDAVGWVDVEGEQFRKILGSCGALVYPSCSEGLSTSTIECMHAGLIPIMSPETGIPAEDFGVELGDCSVAGIRQAVQEVADLPPEEFRDRARRAWKHARAHHTRDHFASVYRDVMTRLLSEHGLIENPPETTPPRRHDADERPLAAQSSG